MANRRLFENKLYLIINLLFKIPACKTLLQGCCRRNPFTSPNTRSPMKSHTSLLAISILQISTAVASTYIPVGSDSTLWTPMVGNFDYHADQQTGNSPVSSDIVGGEGENFGFLVAFNDNGSVSSIDGSLGFRVRLDKPDQSGNNPAAFENVLWVAIDANNNGSLDIFLAANFSGSTSEIQMWAPGNDLNISPSTTSIANTPFISYQVDSIEDVTVANYNYRPVNFPTDGGTTNDVTTNTQGDADYYLSFMVPFNDIVQYLGSLAIPINITDQTSLRFVVATSTQDNSLNQDLGGLPKNFDDTQTWENLGGFTSPYTPVPEPSGSLLLLCSLAGGCLIRRRR